MIQRPLVYGRATLNGPQGPFLLSVTVSLLRHRDILPPDVRVTMYITRDMS